MAVLHTLFIHYHLFSVDRYVRHTLFVLFPYPIHTRKSYPRTLNSHFHEVWILAPLTRQ